MSPIASSPQRLDWLDPPITTDMAIFQSTTAMERPPRRLATTPRTWRPRCSPRLSASTSMPRRHGAEHEQVFRLEKTILKTRNIVQSAEGHPKGLWSTVIAVGVFVF